MFATLSTATTLRIHPDHGGGAFDACCNVALLTAGRVDIGHLHVLGAVVIDLPLFLSLPSPAIPVDAAVFVRRRR